jgi:hypothetical protein
VAEALLRGVAPLLDSPVADIPALRARMAAVAAEVRGVFERRVGRLPEHG